MLFQTSVTLEVAITNGTTVCAAANRTSLFLSCVDGHVFADLASKSEALPTHLTAVGFLASVYAHVVLQTVIVGKQAPAYST